jgi:signal transduction protein with GAF and PtsI domain
MNFLQRAPRPGGEAQVQGESMDASAILNRCVQLVPQIFEYRKVLAKGAKGLGNERNVMRFVDAAGESTARAKIAAYEEAIEAIEVEVQMLMEAGAGDAIGEQLKTARTKVAAFTQIKQTIEGFRDKLNKHMARVEEAYAALSQDMNMKKDEMTKILDRENVELLMKEIGSKHRTVTQLIEAMNEYCALQVAYNGIFLGSR